MRIVEIILNIVLLVVAWALLSIAAPFILGYVIGEEIAEMFKQPKVEDSSDGETV